MTNSKRHFSAEKKALIAISAIKSESRISQLASVNQLHPNQIKRWKKVLEENASLLFSDKRKSENKSQEQLIDQLYRAIGQRDIELEWLKKNYQFLTTADKRTLIDRENPDISLSRQAELLEISRSSIYYKNVVDLEDIRAMEAIDRIYNIYPFLGSRKMRLALQDYDQIFISRDHVRRLMHLMGTEAIYPRKKGLSEPHPNHRVFPYLLSDLQIIKSNQVWGSDITYVKILGGWAYLIAIIDWYSRYVIAWTLAPTLEKEFVVQTYERAFKTAIPEYSNSDQGSQYTANELIDLLLSKEVKISMDGRGRCMDNIFTERLWRTVKYENIYPNRYENFKEAENGLTKYSDFYNNERRHQGLDYKIPAEIYLK